MSQHKFFTGLPPKMESRTKSGPNRQQTQFYWPEDSNKPVPGSQRRMSRSSSKDSGGTNWDVSNYDTDSANKAIRERKSKQLQSRIEFYDIVDEKKNDKSTDLNQNEVKKSEIQVKNEKNSEIKTNGTSNGVEMEKNIENLEERVHEIHLDDNNQSSPPKNRRDYDSYDSEEEYRERRRVGAKKPPSRSSKRQDSWEEYESREVRRPPLANRRPPRSNYDYDDEYYAPSHRGMSRERYRREYYDEYDSRPLPRQPPSPRRYADDYPSPPADDRYIDGPPTPRKYMMDPDYEPIDRDFYYEEPASTSTPTSKDSLPSTTPPTRVSKPTVNGMKLRSPVKRAMSVCSDCPSEISRAMSQRHLKSNIFFTDKEALATNPRPRTVRDSAVNRVCVGLPDIE